MILIIALDELYLMGEGQFVNLIWKPVQQSYYHTIQPRTNINIKHKMSSFNSL